MSLKVGASIPVSTNYIRSNPAVPVYRGDEILENLFAVIYHIEIGYNKDGVQEVKQYIIVDYKEYSLSENDKEGIMNIAKDYCVQKGIDNSENVEIKLLDNEVAENFIERIFNNMKVIRGLITN
ncbi:hypothetical protein [Peptostreptococcus porci]|uniref:hypothetical protein n=1 Tax=Peptostreptococcus porci TaxID=2652282 RepID=UPI0023F21A62|nr:hypothetical protein [Peptostreptococcus porci]MDD7182682.1 hypothetical protein [Peptostreptococcus porci]MDY2794857.1 hypothetical protein [Peptostreptococcus porci]MDY4128458.1 hypothetical protein [Peptostreptococcus porci]MDY4561533.1 hypothetical protein [Peptostreptococcus porci]MDY5435351.1 hypothetical protein [Peptostreptococcus porci]